THVATADARILPRQVAEEAEVVRHEGGGNGGRGGTAYITDLGMCGPHDSVLGRRVDRVLKFMTANTPAPFDVATSNPRVNGIYVEIDEATGLSTRIERIELAADVGQPPFAATV